jgi:hypothetical protein
MAHANAFYYVDNAYYAALEALDDGNEVLDPGALTATPYKLWNKRLLRCRKSKANHLKPLQDLCIRNIADNMDTIWCKDYAENWSGQHVTFLLGPFELLGRLGSTENKNCVSIILI